MMDDWRDEQKAAVAALIKAKFKPLMPNQAKYFESIENKHITICDGCPGVGKSYIACGLAARFMNQGKINKIILVRPVISCGAGLGYLPGNLSEKLIPWNTPLLEALMDFFTKKELALAFEEERIEIAALDMMRGRSIKKSMVILDEAQNADFRQLEMFLTRFDYGSKFVICGDAYQTDLPHRGQNALDKIIDLFWDDCHKEIGIVELTEDDIVRPEIVKWMSKRLA